MAAALLTSPLHLGIAQLVVAAAFFDPARAAERAAFPVRVVLLKACVHAGLGRFLCGKFFGYR